MVINLNKENFEEEVLKSKGITIVKFAAKTGCQPCINFKPKYELASNSNPDKKFCAYERESLRGTPADEIEIKYNIQSFPTVLSFKDGVLEGEMAKYKFYDNRELNGMILDEQKKLFNQQCYVEDLVLESRSRQQPTPCDCSEACQTECESKCEVNDDKCKTDCVDFCRSNPNCTHRLP